MTHLDDDRPHQPERSGAIIASFLQRDVPCLGLGPLTAQTGVKAVMAGHDNSTVTILFALGVGS